MKKNKGGPLKDFLKFPKKKLKMRFANSVTVPKNVIRRTLWDILTSISHAWDFFKISKQTKGRQKSRIAEKNPSEKQTQKTSHCKSRAFSSKTPTKNLMLARFEPETGTPD